MPKKSRTGKKKRPLYGPQGSLENGPAPVSPQEVQEYRNARRANWGAIFLLVVAMVLIFFAPNFTHDNLTYNIVCGIAYGITAAAGVLILYTAKFVEEKRLLMTRITGWLMVGLGLFGIVFSILGQAPQ
jgi:uncharacterized membrane protein YbaN (DUF454 family)